MSFVTQTNLSAKTLISSEALRLLDGFQTISLVFSERGGKKR